MPHLHVGGDFWVVIGAAIAMVATTVWAFRRWGTSAGGLDPALAEAVDEVFVACDLDEPAPVERTEQSDEFAGV